MDTTSITIDLPQNVKTFIDHQAAAKGFGSPEEYIRAVLEAEEDRVWRSEVDQHLLAGLGSGPATPLTKQDWEEIRRQGLERLSMMKKT